MTVDLRAVYDRFFALGGPPPKDRHRPWRYRRPVTSMGWPGCEMLGMLVRTYRPRRVLDLGSGVTSHILRALIAEVPGMQVVTTDASRGWLQTTIMELRRDGLSDAHCFVHDAFEASALANEPFDVISVDIFDTRFRRDLSRKLAQWLAPAGVMLLDDWHKSHYAPTMTARLEQLGLTVEPRVDTRDEWGRFVALAYRVAS